ncbi:flavin reductase family protein [Streptomyces sp. XM4193]|nr:flavin reductase family protein [Streptomyces sp. XM4193]MCK1797782.1 flavin reductase family protein [Streptomyces sp. XM4193]
MLDQPVQIVTAAAGGERAGCLVGFAGQCSLRPVRFAVWLSRVNRIWRIADRADHLGVHLLDPERLDLARLFGGETGDETDKFARVQWRWGPCGVPVLEEAAAWCVGAVLGRVDGGDHEGFLLDPVRAAVPRDRTRGAFLSLDDTLHLDPGHP